MPIFDEKCIELFKQFNESAKMVLSTSLNDKVTSRMMSIIVQNGKFYFQTDITLRKYSQLKENPCVAICMENLQIEGTCAELGHPREFPEFCMLYSKYFASSYKRYTYLCNERLFAITPQYIQKWVYQSGEPFIETYDFAERIYDLRQYDGV